MSELKEVFDRVLALANVCGSVLDDPKIDNYSLSMTMSEVEYKKRLKKVGDNIERRLHNLHK